LVREALLGLGRALEVIDPEAAEGYYRDLGDETQLPPSIAATVQNRARYRLGWLRLENGQWDQAAQAFELVNAPRDLAFSAAELARAAPQGDQLPSRSPAAAAAMSAVLPGAGQLYVGRPVDAALAFGLNAAFITGTVAAAQDENWPVFALLGIIEVVWYGGNLYNAINGAHRYNQDQKDAFLKELRRDHGFRLGYSPARKGVFAAWSIRF
jgi:TM2 domain-containing membrane protein YozV